MTSIPTCPPRRSKQMKRPPTTVSERARQWALFISLKDLIQLHQKLQKRYAYRKTGPTADIAALFVVADAATLVTDACHIGSFGTDSLVPGFGKS